MWVSDWVYAMGFGSYRVSSGRDILAASEQAWLAAKSAVAVPFCGGSSFFFC